VAVDDGCGAATCGVQWSATPGPGQRQPSVGGRVVFTVGSDDGSIEAYDAGGCGAATCQPLWTGDVGPAITGSPAVANGRVYVSTPGNDVVAFGLPAGG
jgi:outer membrane protein assembly factor BamB